MSKHLNRLSEKITLLLNDVSLKAKVLIVFAICVVLPVALSCVIFSAYLNKYFCERETESIEYAAERVNEEVRLQIDQAVSMTNVVASDRVINRVVQEDFGSEREYYRYSVEHGLRDYFQLYYTQQEFVEKIGVYLFNDTIMNGGIIWRIDKHTEAEEWYKRCSGADNPIVLCVDYSKSSDADARNYKTISVVRRITEDVGGDRVVGYIKADIDMDVFRSRLTYSGEYPKFYLVSTYDGLIYDPSAGKFSETDGDYAERMTGKNLFEISLDDTSYLYGWKILCAYDRSRIVQQQIIHTLIVVGINLIVGLIMLICVVFIYKSYNDRLSRLAHSMIKVEKGDFNEVNIVPGKDEIGVVVQTYNHMVNSINNLINDVYKLEIKNQHMEIENTKAELKYLQSQIDPHFIFNILNAMRIVSIEKDYTLLTEQLSGFAKMIRRLLDWSEDYEPLTTEMEFVKIYLQLEKFRFEDKFDYDMDIDDSINDCRMPKMIIQPIVENACRHGLQGKIGHRYLHIGAAYTDGVLRISVRDNGNGIEPDKLRELKDGLESGDFEGHIGLKNVYRRLKLYFENYADMEILSEPGQGTEVIITVRYKDIGDEDNV